MEPEGLGKLSNVPLCSASHPAFQQAWTSPHPGITLQDVPRELSAGDHGTTICQSQGKGKVTTGLKVDACVALQAASQEAWRLSKMPAARGCPCQCHAKGLGVPPIFSGMSVACTDNDFHPAQTEIILGACPGRCAAYFLFQLRNFTYILLHLSACGETHQYLELFQGEYILEVAHYKPIMSNMQM